MASDPFWFNKVDILFDRTKMLEFWPSKFQSYEERINAITRFILYAGAIMSFYKHTSEPFVMAIILVVIIVLTSKSKNKILNKLIRKPNEDCQLPSMNNPMGNYMPYDSVERKKACNSDLVSDEINEQLFAQFPTAGLSSTNKSFIQRQFFSTANTDIVNDQKAFATYLYGNANKKMCKTNPEVCTGYDLCQYT